MLNRRADKQELLKIVEAVGLEKSIEEFLIPVTLNLQKINGLK